MGNNNSAPSSKKPSEELVGVEIPNESKHNTFGGLRLSISNGESSQLLLEDGDATDLANALFEASEEGLDQISDEERADAAFNGDQELEPLPSPAENNTSIKLKVYRCSDVRIESVVGEGEFGKVSKAILQGRHRVPVAVRVFNAPFDGTDTFGQLNAIMKLKHRNVVSVLGILDSTNSSSVYGPKVLLHYFPEGNLLQFLSSPNNPQDFGTLVKLALDVIQGCEYLHSRNVVHGNLAARNILIEKQRGKVLTHYNAKVTDHGIIQLTKAKGRGRNYMRVHNGYVLPIRWVPKELLEEHTFSGFTFSSDVWSFGVVFWEMLTKGSVPYGRRKEECKVVQLIRDGQSPLNIRIPEGYPYEIINVMKRIFKVNPKERPPFWDLRKEFISISASVKVKPHDTGSKFRLDPSTDKDSNPAMNDAVGYRGSRRRRDESKTRGTESFPGRRSRGSRSSGGSGFTGRTLNSDETPNAKVLLQNEVPKLMELGGRGASCQRTDQSPLQSTGSRGNSYRRSTRNERATGQGGDSTNPPEFSFLPIGSGARNNGPFEDYANPLSIAVTSPPPYSSSPPPDYCAYFGRESGSSRRGDRRVDYTKEIKKKEQELEQLKLQKLQREATEAFSRMKSILSQFTELKLNTGTAAPTPTSRPPRNGNNERRHQSDASYDRSRSRGEQSRSSKQSSVSSGRGHGRSHSHGRKGEDSKLTVASSDKSSIQENVF